MTGPVDIPPLPSPPPAVDERHWPALLAFFTVGILPATTARRTAQVRLRSAFVIHLVAGLVAAAIMLFLHTWYRVSGPADFGTVYVQTEDAIGGWIDEVGLHPIPTLLIAVAYVAGIEIGHLAGALVCAPWGAADEPLSASIRNAIQRVWLATPHLALVVLLAGGAATFCARARWDASVMAAQFADKVTEKAQRSGNAASYDDWYNAYHEALSQSPRYARQGIDALVWCGGGAWWLWALLRSVGRSRPLSPVARPPMCESCGYNLTGIPLASRCPECGEPVILSLGPAVRALTPWQQRRPVGRSRALLHCLVGAIRRPMRFGRRAPLYPPRSDHRWTLAAVLVPLFLVGWMGIIACYVVGKGHWPTIEDSRLLWPLGPIFGCLTCLAAVPFALITASMAGLTYSVKSRRNLLSGAMQAASYSASYLILWAIVSYVFAAAGFETSIYLWGTRLSQIQRRLVIAVVFAILPNASCFATYLWLVARIMAGMRYANR